VEFEPRIARLRQRIAKLESEAAVLQDEAEQARSLQLVIGKLETFATMVQDRLDEADWPMRRDIIRTLVRRIEIDDQCVRVIFRVDPPPSSSSGPRQISPHCPERLVGLPRVPQPRDRRRRQVRCLLAQQAREHLLEVAHR